LRVEVGALRGEPCEPVLGLWVFLGDTARREFHIRGNNLRASAEEILQGSHVDENTDLEGLAWEAQPKKRGCVRGLRVEFVDSVLEFGGYEFWVEGHVVCHLDAVLSICRLCADLDLGTAFRRQGKPLVLLAEREASELVWVAQSAGIKRVIDGLAVGFRDHGEGVLG